MTFRGVIGRRRPPLPARKPSRPTSISRRRLRSTIKRTGPTSCFSGSAGTAPTSCLCSSWASVATPLMSTLANSAFLKVSVCTWPAWSSFDSFAPVCTLSSGKVGTCITRNTRLKYATWMSSTRTWSKLRLRRARTTLKTSNISGKRRRSVKERSSASHSNSPEADILISSLRGQCSKKPSVF